MPVQYPQMKIIRTENRHNAKGQPLWEYVIKIGPKCNGLRSFRQYLSSSSAKATGEKKLEQISNMEFY